MVGDKIENLKSKAKSALDKIINKEPEVKAKCEDCDGPIFNFKEGCQNCNKNLQVEKEEVKQFKSSKDSGKFVYNNIEGKRVYNAKLPGGTYYVFFRGKPLLINPKFEKHIEYLRTIDCLQEVI